MDPIALRVRDRQFIKTAVLREYPGLCTSKVALALPEPELMSAMVEAMWETRPEISDKTAFLGISRAVKKLFELMQRAPQAWEGIKRVLDIPGWDGMSLGAKAKALGAKLKDLLHEGKSLLGKSFKTMATTFPLSLFFVSKEKMPGLTDLLARIMKAVPGLEKALLRIGEGAVKIDSIFEKHIPRLRKPVYAAIFIWVWLNVSEISWDVQGILSGFTGQISLSELLASLPESGVGFIAAAFGLGYGALPYALIARLIWLVAQNYISYAPGKGFVVHWGKMGIRQRDEMVPA